VVAADFIEFICEACFAALVGFDYFSFGSHFIEKNHHL